MAALNFAADQVSYVEWPLDLPGPCLGKAEIVEEIPTRIKVAADMQTRGLVVLSDLWDSGWHAYLDGRQVPVLRTNHAVRGVEAPAGKSTIEFRYEPASLTWGLRISGLGLLASIGWLGLGLRKAAPMTPGQPEPELPRKELTPNLPAKKRDDRRSSGRRSN